MSAEAYKGLAIGIDLDGVLANQVVGVLSRIQAQYGIVLRYEDITHWRLPIEAPDVATDIASEIVAAQTDRDYVLSMPVHPGAHEMLEVLRHDFRIIVLTARAGEALEWSAEWLRINSLHFDSIAGSEEAKKSLHGVDALVDDYLGNVEEFLANTAGPAVLVDQPWNRLERRALEGFGERVVAVSTLAEVPDAVAALLGHRGSGQDNARATKHTEIVREPRANG
jgi:uncharacterized HAD superfamily protein